MKEELEPERNKLGLTLKDYICPKCGYNHATAFAYNLPIKRCYHCRNQIIQKMGVR